MNLGDVNLACAWALVDELVRGGVRHACVSPGSRSTSLALALDRHPAVTVHVHLDERSSAFFALGIAKSVLRPVVVACTSGTAATELWPAVVEASQARMALVLLTADRPPRLRGTGANQTIDQEELYGRYVRAFLEAPVPQSPADAETWQDVAGRALDALAPLSGPIHVNCPFEEPLVPRTDTGPLHTSGEPRDPGSWTRAADPDDADRFARAISAARGVLVAGGHPGDVSGTARFFAEALHWPVIAEPSSGARRPKEALAAGQALLGSATWLDTHRPDVVVQIGATPTTRATQSFVAAAERLIVVDRLHPDPDPEGRATIRIRADPDELVRAIAGRPVSSGAGLSLMGVEEGSAPPDAREPLGEAIDPAPDGWLAEWRGADDRARAVLDAALDADDEPNELRIARDLAATVPDGSTLVVGSSMPIRDLDYAMAPRGALRVLANRGASGIDGFVSTALGVAAAGPGPTFALSGDLTLLHDVGGLLWNARRGLDAVFVVPNNGGGTIFSFLDQRDLPELEPLFVTPHGLDLGAVCAAAGANHHRVERAGELGRAIVASASARGLDVVEVIVDPVWNRRRHAEVQAVVDAELRRLAT
jgi:2-succinyl-5-enolpyruvyl-6-hydroxy-3-cyclohexene-1-carboxylate synthase